MTRPVHPRAITAVLSLSGLVVAIMQMMIVPILPEMPQLLGSTANDSSWLLTATMLAGAVATPTLGRLADMYGKRRILHLTLGSVVVGSVIGILATSLPTAITARAFQGVGIALVPIAISILRDELPREQLNVAVGFVSATVGIGAALGLPLSGFVYSHFGWHALFLLSATMAAVMAIAVAIVVPESPVRNGGRFDILGAGMLTGALLLLLLGVTKGNDWGWTSSRLLGCLAMSAVLFCLWVPWQLRVRDPVVDLRTSRRRPVLLTYITALLAGFAMYCNMLTLTHTLQVPAETGYGFGMSPFQASLYMLPVAGIMIVVAPLAAMAVRVVGGRAVIVAAMLCMLVGYLLRLTVAHSPWQITVAAMIVTSGTAISYAAMPIVIMHSVPITETASANGVNAVMRYAGTASASAATAMILTSLTVAGTAIPTQSAFRDVYLMAAAVSAVAICVALALPRKKAEFEANARMAAPVMAAPTSGV